MARVCKHAEENRKAKLCKNYFISYSRGGREMCRLSEWKVKAGVCPYDCKISSAGFRATHPAQTFLKKKFPPK